jgi:hypothetical protein
MLCYILVIASKLFSFHDRYLCTDKANIQSLKLAHKYTWCKSKAVSIKLHHYILSSSLDMQARIETLHRSGSVTNGDSLWQAGESLWVAGASIRELMGMHLQTLNVGLC